MVNWGRARTVLVALGWAVFSAQAHDGASLQALTSARPELLSSDARDAVIQIVDRADNGDRPFAIVDKRAARLFVFDVTGRLVGDTPILLGLARGDQSAPDVANRPPNTLTPAERTTPAGRYASEPGHNEKGEDIVWIDYEASLAIHRLRPSPPAERRAERLASPNPDDKRISYGCVVVPVLFYDEVVKPTLGSSRGLVYVLPESEAARRAWPTSQVASDLR